jgi:hypothetical protein
VPVTPGVRVVAGVCDVMAVFVVAATVRVPEDRVDVVSTVRVTGGDTVSATAVRSCPWCPLISDVPAACASGATIRAIAIDDSATNSSAAVISTTVRDLSMLAPPARAYTHTGMHWGRLDERVAAGLKRALQADNTNCRAMVKHDLPTIARAYVATRAAILHNARCASRSPDLCRRKAFVLIGDAVK